MGTMSIACDCSEEHKYQPVNSEKSSTEQKRTEISVEIPKYTTLNEEIAEIAEIPQKRPRGRPKRAI